VADLPFQLAPPLGARLAAALDLEGKIPRALEALGPLAGRDVALVDVPPGVHLDRLDRVGVHPVLLPASDPLRLEVADASLDAVVFLWTGFGEVDDADLAEVDRVLRPYGRLLVVHDYGRDDVCRLDPDRPALTSWSRRDGPYLRQGAFKIRVLHCFWTFESIEDAGGFLGDAFGPAGTALAATLRRPRLTWNVAVYHRWRAGVAPAAVTPAAVGIGP
jgi:SAM-dependent methyltransferase